MSFKYKNVFNKDFRTTRCVVIHRYIDKHRLCLYLRLKEKIINAYTYNETFESLTLYSLVKLLVFTHMNITFLH